MFRGGGTAGGGLKKNQIQFTKQQPKFLQQFRYQANERSMEGATIKLQEAYVEQNNRDSDKYDTENALVVNEEGYEDEEITKRKKAAIKQDLQKPPAQKELVQKVDLDSFKPQFVSKKAPVPAEEEKGKEDKDDKEKDQKGKEEKGKEEKGKEDKGKGKTSTDAPAGNDKQNLQKQEQKAVKAKKVKYNTLSFDD